MSKALYIRCTLLIASILVFSTTHSQDTLDFHAVKFERQSVTLDESKSEIFLLHSADKNHLIGILTPANEPPSLTFNDQVLPYSKIANGKYLYVVNCTNNEPIKLSVVSKKKTKLLLLGERRISLFVASDGLTVNTYKFIEYGVLFLLLFIGILGSIAYSFLKRKEYLYYALYSFGICIYLYLRLFHINYHATYTNQETEFLNLCTRLIQPLIFSFYILFSIYFLDMKTKYPLGFRVQRSLIAFSVFAFFAMLFSYYLSGTIFYLVYDGYRVILAILSICVVFYFILKRDLLANYLIIGSLILILCQVTAMILTFQNTRLWNLYPLAFIGIGSTLELLFFTMGIIQKSILLVREKSRVQLDLISQLKINESLQKDKEIELERLINEARTQIEKEQKLKVESQIRLQLVEAEMTSLHAQMNPHFLFNSMNSLKRHILKKNTHEAVQYLDKLSILVRNILRFSRKRRIKLHDELENVRLYMELENLRVSTPITFSLQVDPSINTEFIEIPPLLLQPIIENAIWHGHANSDIQNPFIKLAIKRGHEKVIISVEDNGIGRARAANYSSGNNNHNSVATEITTKRVDLINKGRGGFEIIDLYTDDQPSGTKVLITLYEY